MFKKGFLILMALFSVAIAQVNDNQTLFTIAGDEVKVSEFVRVYTKNNINNQADFSKKSLDEYLDLYEKFRLKVKEAESLGMDTALTFINELESYRSQLTQSYLSDRKATEALVKEAYDRMQEEVNVSHILIFWPNANPSKEDSTKVLNEIKKIKTAAEKTSFEEQIAIYNKSNQTKYPKNKQKYEGGNLGYVSVFQTVYPFENAMYNTKVGEISEPIITRFGYHLVFVKDKRPARGKMKTAHVLIKSKETDSPENKKTAKDKAFEIYYKITNIEDFDFEDAVKEYSEDKKTKYQGGKLPELSSSEMLLPFAEAAFALKEDNDISKPVKTDIGWHIIKRISKNDLKEFNFAKHDLEKKVERDSRSNVAKELMINDSKNKFGYQTFNTAKQKVIDALINSKEKGKYTINSNEYKEYVFGIGENKFTQKDFIKFVKKTRNKRNTEDIRYLNNQYTAFENAEITKYREAHLEEIDEDFKNLMQEYHDGILLFELTNTEVWTKAVEDTFGLQNFFKMHRDDYVWKERIEYTTYTAQDEKTAKKLHNFLVKGKSKEFIIKKLNKKEKLVETETKKVEKDANDLVKSLEWTKGFVSKENNLNGSVQITTVDNIIKPTQKELSETRGYVISDYQDYLEKSWIVKLKQKYDIKLNKNVFNSLIKK